MSSCWHEAASDENDVRQLKKACEFPEGIKQQDARGTKSALKIFDAGGKRGAPYQFKSLLLNHASHFVTSSGMTRRKDQKRLRMSRADFSPGDQHLFFLTRHRAGRHPNGPALSVSHSLLQQSRKFATSGRLPIKLEIAHHKHPLSRSANFKEARGVGRSLREDCIDVLKDLAHKKPEQAIPAQRAIRKTGIHQNHLRAGLVGRSQQVWPDLGFHNHQQRRADAVKNPPNGTWPIERQVKAPSKFRKALLPRFASRRRDVTHENTDFGMPPLKLLNESRNGQGLTHRNGMDPD